MRDSKHPWSKNDRRLPRFFAVVGLYKLNPTVTLSLKAPGFNP
jgi:hypothetical protein